MIYTRHPNYIDAAYPIPDESGKVWTTFYVVKDVDGDPSIDDLDVEGEHLRYYYDRKLFVRCDADGVFTIPGPCIVTTSYDYEVEYHGTQKNHKYVDVHLNTHDVSHGLRIGDDIRQLRYGDMLRDDERGYVYPLMYNDLTVKFGDTNVLIEGSSDDYLPYMNKQSVLLRHTVGTGREFTLMQVTNLNGGNCTSYKPLLPEVFIELNKLLDDVTSGTDVSIVFGMDDSDLPDSSIVYVLPSNETKHMKGTSVLKYVNNSLVSTQKYIMWFNITPVFRVGDDVVATTSTKAVDLDYGKDSFFDVGIYTPPTIARNTLEYDQNFRDCIWYSQSMNKIVNTMVHIAIDVECAKHNNEFSANDTVVDGYVGDNSVDEWIPSPTELLDMEIDYNEIAYTVYYLITIETQLLYAKYHAQHSTFVVGNLTATLSAMLEMYRNVDTKAWRDVDKPTYPDENNNLVYDVLHKDISFSSTRGSSDDSNVDHLDEISIIEDIVDTTGFNDLVYSAAIPPSEYYSGDEVSYSLPRNIRTDIASLAYYKTMVYTTCNLYDTVDNVSILNVLSYDEFTVEYNELVELFKLMPHDNDIFNITKDVLGSVYTRSLHNLLVDGKVEEPEAQEVIDSEYNYIITAKES